MELARELLPRFLALCPEQCGRAGAGTTLSDPDRVLVRLDSFIDAYGARATLYELWTQNPSLFELLLLLFDRSEFLAERAIRTPDLVDELELSGRLQPRQERGGNAAGFAPRRGDADQRLWLRRYHQAELMRIGLRDILGLADFEQNLFELSALADACLQYALEVVMRRPQIQTAALVRHRPGKTGRAGNQLRVGPGHCVCHRMPREKIFRNCNASPSELMDLLSAQTEAGRGFQD